MKINYETPDVIELGRAQDSIWGQKVIDPLFIDFELGWPFRTIELDIDESDD